MSAKGAPSTPQSTITSRQIFQYCTQPSHRNHLPCAVQVFNSFSVADAQATVPQDRDRILAAIEASIGSTKLNLTLKRALVDSALHEAAHTTAKGAALAAVQVGHP